MKIILIAGKSGSGKTTLAEEILKEAQKEGKRVLKTEFSKYVKLYAQEMVGYTIETKEQHRKFLQDMGSMVRGMDEDFFIDRMLDDFVVYESLAYDIVVISDVRLINEIKKIKKSKYQVITCKVMNAHGKDKLMGSLAEHVTETELDTYKTFDFIIVNKKETDLKEAAKNLLL